jgi:site-specific recombinase XerC
MKTQATFSELLQAYFTQRLMHECNASPHTIANYRDTFRLLIGFAHRLINGVWDAVALGQVSQAEQIGSHNVLCWL